MIERAAWTLAYGDYDPKCEGVREALCTLGNGRFATRGAAAESRADAIHYPGTYMAGGYDRRRTEFAGRVLENEDLVNLPNWLPLAVRPDGGEWLSPDTCEVLSYHQELDLRRGVLTRAMRLKDGAGRITALASRRLVSMAAPELAAEELTVVAENWSGRAEALSALDATVENLGVRRYRGLESRHLRPLAAETPASGICFLKVETIQSGIRVALAARTHAFGPDGLLGVDQKEEARPGFVGRQLGFTMVTGEPVRLEKVVALHTSRDFGISEPAHAARAAARAAGDFAALLNAHAQAWESLWRRFDLELELTEDDGGRTVRTLRLHIFHLLQVASPHVRDLDAGVPARGLHGEAYRGHVFWDELFIFPFLNLRLPEITRSLLLYRHRRLAKARRLAEEAGFSGAMYPWQSGSSGREESQRCHMNPSSGRWVPDWSWLQRHVGSAIAFNVWQYYQATGDLEFLSAFGAEMILEIARFWASIATFDVALGRYEILGVMGPDEYHDGYPGTRRPGIDNNAYTNLMAVWVLCRALDVLDILPEDRRIELSRKLGLRSVEIEHWRLVSRRMYVVFHDNGIISQFEDYRTLEEFDWQEYSRRYDDIQRLDRILEAEGDSVNRYKVSKQADALMLFYLLSTEQLTELFHRLGYSFPPDTIQRTIEYYLARTSHGSTLSRVVHAWVLARLDRKRSWQLFTEALMSDIADIQGGTTAEGLHLGAMAGTVDLIQRCYTGLETRGDVLWINPRLPDALRRLRVHLRYRGHALELDVTHREVTVRALLTMAESIRIGYDDAVHELAAGESRTFRIPQRQRPGRPGPAREAHPP